MKKVAIVMGSDSDMPVAEKAMKELEKYEVPYEAHIYSAHRTPDEARQFALMAKDDGIGVIIALAGKAAHLAGSLAASTLLPVIGVPIKSSNMEGLDSLLSTVQMPSGIPVATVGIDNAANAAILAVEIIALGDEELEARLRDAREAATQAVLDKNDALQKK